MPKKVKKYPSVTDLRQPIALEPDNDILYHHILLQIFQISLKIMNQIVQVIH